MTKEDIRIRIKAQKSLLSDEERRQAASRVFAMLEQSAAFLMADRILMYHSLPDELSTIEFIDKWHTKKHFFLPRVNGVNLEILPYEKSALRLGSFYIEEPEGDDIQPIDSIELVIVPAVAYDRKGNRVGRGKGYYDRLLADTRATKIGVGYDFQLVDDIDTESHDVIMDAIITESSMITVHHHGKQSR